MKVTLEIAFWADAPTQKVIFDSQAVTLKPAMKAESQNVIVFKPHPMSLYCYRLSTELITKISAPRHHLLSFVEAVRWFAHFANAGGDARNMLCCARCEHTDLRTQDGV
jgi:hypothetical protein